MVVSVAAPLRATAAHQRSWVPLRESPTAYEVSRAASRALVRRQLAHPSSLEGASTEMPTINSETLTAFLSDLRLDSFEPLLARLTDVVPAAHRASTPLYTMLARARRL